jgi:hypothetical protein
MKKIILAIAIFFAANAATVAQTQQGTTHKKHHTKVVTKYTCPMHPEIVRSKPGKCPKCGMTLVKMKKK